MVTGHQGTTWMGLAVLGLFVGLSGGCDAGPEETQELGTLELALAADAPADYAALELRVVDDGSGEEVYADVFLLKGAPNFSASLSLPTGQVTVHGTALDPDGQVVGEGSAGASIEADKPAKAVLVLNRPADGGGEGVLSVSTVFNDAPTLSGLFVQPSVTLPGQQVVLTATVQDDGPGVTFEARLETANGTQPLEAQFTLGGGLTIVFNAPDTPGSATIVLTATDLHGASDTVTVPVIVCNPALTGAGTDLADAVDAVMGNIANEIFTEPSQLLTDGGWMMTLDSGAQVTRAFLDYQVEPLLPFGYGVVLPAVNWIFSGNLGARYAAAYLIRELSGTDAHLPVFDVAGLDDEYAFQAEAFGPDDEEEEEEEEEERKCCVESFVVTWKENANAGATQARLRLDYAATFGAEDPCDPACCEFRQNVKTVWSITAGDHAGQGNDTSPMHDDNYSRADDTDDDKDMDDPGFTSNDNPGIPGVSANDVLDYAFTAEQMIIDTCNGNGAVAKRGPHTGTITGAHPRVYGGVPKTLDK